MPAVSSPRRASVSFRRSCSSKIENITTAAASGEMPDVVGALPLAAVSQMATNDLLDSDAAKAVVDELGRGTFSPRALELTGQDGNQLAVPSDGWAQLLFYRKDLFDKAGLGAPLVASRVADQAHDLAPTPHFFYCVTAVARFTGSTCEIAIEEPFETETVRAGGRTAGRRRRSRPSR